MSALAVIGRVEARGIAHRRWFLASVLIGLAIIIAGAVLAGGRDGLAALDTMRSWTAAVYLVGGLAVAATLGASAVNRDADGGWVGMQVVTGTPRPTVLLARIAGRLVMLLATFAIWMAAAAICSAVIGQGGDGPLFVHGLAMLENMVLVLVIAALSSVVLGPVASGVVAAFAYVSFLSLGNLMAATNADAIGTAWSGLITTLYLTFPRAITSPMLSEMQARGAAGVAGAQLEINLNVVVVPASSWLSVLWTLAWCAALAAIAAAAFRRRALS